MFKPFSYKLDPPDLEVQFRQEGLKRDTHVAIALLLVSIFFHILSFPMDLELLRGSNNLYIAWAIRAFSAAVAAVTAILARRSRHFGIFENMIFIWAILLAMGVMGANALFPADYTTHVAWDLLLALGAYALLPIGLTRQALVAIVFTFGDIILFSQHKDLDHPAALVDMTAAFICANIVGVYISWWLQRWRRKHFTSLRQESAARHRLEMALLEIKTLQGIIPICSKCKKVRTDEGQWRQVEAYVRDHTEADFSHGICPECEKGLYLEMEETFP